MVKEPLVGTTFNILHRGKTMEATILEEPCLIKNRIVFEINGKRVVRRWIGKGGKQGVTWILGTGFSKELGGCMNDHTAIV